MFNDPQMKMGYQLFSVREDMAKDPCGTLTALKAMGYEDFEAYGFKPEENKIYGLSPIDYRVILDDLQLTNTSCHFGFSNYLGESEAAMDRFTDQCITCAKTLGMRYVTWPWMAPEQRTMATFRRLPDLLNRIGERVSAAGLGFAYHNNGFEFEDHDGENGYDLMLNETDPDLVKLQLDMYWVIHAGKTTPKELVGRHPGRFVMWHLKDMHQVSRDYTELGNGSINYADVLPNPVTSGLERYYLEQGGNYTHNAMKSAEDSASFFKAQLRKLL
jgi:sugar phosphate isomerase/epimerase